MSAVAAGIGHIAVRRDFEHKSSSVPSGAHIIPGTGHKATDTGKSAVFGAGEDVDDVFHEVLSSSGHFTEDIVMDPASDLPVSGAFLEHHLPGEHHFTSPSAFKFTDHHEGGAHFDTTFSLFGDGAHHLAPEPILSASNEVFSIPGHLPGERRLFDKVAVSFNDDKHTFSITDSTTFSELVKEALHVWGLASGSPKYELHDEQGEPYAISAQVQRTLAAQPPRTPHWIPVLVLGEKKKKKRKMKETDPTKKTTKKTKKPKDKDAQAAAGAKAGDATNGAPAQPADAAKPAAAAATPKVPSSKSAAKAQPKGAESAKPMPVRSPQKLLSTSAGAVMVGVAPGAVQRTVKPGDLSVSTPMEGVVDATNSATASASKPAAVAKPAAQIMYANGGTQANSMYKGPAQAGSVQVQSTTQNLSLTSLQQQQAAAQRLAQVQAMRQKPGAVAVPGAQQPGVPAMDLSKAAAKPAAPGATPLGQAAQSPSPPTVGQPTGAAAQATGAQATGVPAQLAAPVGQTASAQQPTPAQLYAVQQQARMVAPGAVANLPTALTAAGAPSAPTTKVDTRLLYSKPAARVASKPVAMMQRTSTGMVLSPGAVAQTSGAPSIVSSVSPSAAPKQATQPAQPSQPGAQVAVASAAFKPSASPLVRSASGTPVSPAVLAASQQLQMQQQLLQQAQSNAVAAAQPQSSPPQAAGTQGVSAAADAAAKSVAPPVAKMAPATVRTDVKSVPVSAASVSSPISMANISVSSSQAAAIASQALQATLPHRNSASAGAAQTARLPAGSPASATAALALSAQLAASAVGRIAAGAAGAGAGAGAASALPPSGATTSTAVATHAAPASQPPANSPPQPPGSQQ